ncbi:ABC transporter permease [Nocardioides limicola]|uniref:ABC transporter permease n=1 Tax=Nocardioides limicola TaxID=2803368 RepID=UPI00193B8E83|nr:ABC transporter permease [Nocardioides sp. DJM-14]
MSANSGSGRSARGAGVSGSGAVALVASREIRTRITSKTYLLSLAAVVVAIVAGGVLMRVLGDDDPTRIGFHSPVSGLAGEVALLAEATEVAVETTTWDDLDRAEQMLSDGEIDVLVALTDGGWELVVERTLPPEVEWMFFTLSQQHALADELLDVGVDAQQLLAVMAQAQPEVRTLDADAEVDGGRMIAGYLVGILIFIALMTTGQMVAVGVVEEKTSRVVELLLATVRPWQLLAGKVIGIGVIGLVQVVAIIGAGVATALALGLLGDTSMRLGSVALWSLGWFLIGYVSYAVVLAGLGALVSRQEEVSGVIGPVTMLMVLPYMAGIMVAPWEPGSSLVVALSWIPLCAPFVMPMRMAFGSPEMWEVWGAAGVSLALLPVLIWLAARMYSGAVLSTGARVGILQSLRR